MRGPEHYAAGEALLARAAGIVESGVGSGPEFVQALATMADAHFQAATAAATIELVAMRGPGDLTQEWASVLYPGTVAAKS